MRLIQHAFRLYLEPDRLDDTIAFYEGLQGIACGLRIALPQQGIDVAVVGAFVLLAGSEHALAAVRDAQAVLTVDSLDDAAAWLRSHGATILHAPRPAPGGRNLTARHPDGLIAEYYQPVAPL